MTSKGKEPNSLELDDSGGVNVQKNNLFDHILTKVKKVDFINEIQEFGGVDKPLAKHYQITAIRKLIDLGIGFRYTNQIIYIYNGAYWEDVNDEAFTSFIGDVALKMGINPFDSDHYKYRKELLNQFWTKTYKQEPKADKNTVLINLANGTLEIDNGTYRMKPFDKDDFLTYQLSFSYDQSATSPIFKKYLDRVLPDKSAQNVLSEYLGYLFIRNGGSGIKIEKMLALKGGGANGKSVLYEIITELLGRRNTTNFSLHQLTDSQGRFRYQIQNKLLNYASENKNNGVVDESMLKRIASGEGIHMQSMFKNPITGYSYAKVILNLNNDVVTSDHTDSFFRRFILIPFDVTIPEEEQDRELHHKIIDAELPGVMNWILKGLDRILKNKKLSYSKIIEDELIRFKTESNTVALFVQDQGYYVCDCQTPSKEIFNRYVAFCVEDGYKRVSQIKFNRRLKQLHIEKKKVEVWKMDIGQVVNISNIKRNVDLDGNPISEEEEKAELERLEIQF